MIIISSVFEGFYVSPFHPASLLIPAPWVRRSNTWWRAWHGTVFPAGLWPNVATGVSGVWERVDEVRWTVILMDWSRHTNTHTHTHTHTHTPSSVQSSEGGKDKTHSCVSWALPAELIFEGRSNDFLLLITMLSMRPPVCSVGEKQFALN